MVQHDRDLLKSDTLSASTFHQDIGHCLAPKGSLMYVDQSK